MPEGPRPSDLTNAPTGIWADGPIVTGCPHRGPGSVSIEGLWPSTHTLPLLNAPHRGPCPRVLRTSYGMRRRTAYRGKGQRPIHEANGRSNLTNAPTGIWADGPIVTGCPHRGPGSVSIEGLWPSTHTLPLLNAPHRGPCPRVLRTSYGMRRRTAYRGKGQRPIHEANGRSTTSGPTAL